MKIETNGMPPWNRREEVINRLDYRAAFRELGMEVIGGPGKNGWVAVRIDEDDKHPSGTYNTHTGTFRDKRNAEWRGSIFDLRVALGKADDPTEAFTYYANMAGVGGHGHGQNPKKPTPGGFGHGKGRIVASYDYADGVGEIVATKHRTEGPDGKDFFFKPSWPDDRRLLYRLPDLIGATDDEIIHICEGEKDADRLASMGMVATTLFSSSGPWSPDYARVLSGRHVAIHEDNDEVGRKYSAMWATGLAGHAKTIRVVRYTDMPEKGDVSDWLDQLDPDSLEPRTREDLDTRVLGTPFWVPKIRRTANLGDLSIDNRGRFICPGFLIRDHFNLLSSHPKIGKTHMGLDLAKRIYMGLPWPTGHPATFETGTKTLWVPGDRHQDELKERAIAFGLPLDAILFNAYPDDDPYGGWNLDDPENIKRLRELIIIERPGLVFIDTVWHATKRKLCREDQVNEIIEVDPIV